MNERRGKAAASGAVAKNKGSGKGNNGAGKKPVDIGDAVSYRVLGEEGNGTVTLVIGRNFSRKPNPAIKVATKESPFGTSLLGARVGQTLTVTLPAREVKVQILGIVPSQKL